MNIGYHDNFWGKSPYAMFEMADWENAQIEQINRDFQAAMPHIIALAKAQLDADEFAEFVAEPECQREWFYEMAEDYTTASREMLCEWFHSN